MRARNRNRVIEENRQAWRYRQIDGRSGMKLDRISNTHAHTHTMGDTRDNRTTSTDMQIHTHTHTHTHT